MDLTSGDETETDVDDADNPTDNSLPFAEINCFILQLCSLFDEVINVEVGQVYFSNWKF